MENHMLNGAAATGGDLADLTAGATEKQSGDDTIMQVRELLFGQEQRSFEAQISSLRAEIAVMKQEFEERLAASEASLQAALAEGEAANKERIAQIGEAIQFVGRTIGALSEK